MPEEKDDLKHISKFSGSYGLALFLKKIIIYLLMGGILYKQHIQSGKNFKVITLPLTKKKII